MKALAGRALGVTQALLALGNEVTRTELATFVRNGEAPRIWDANHVAHPAASAARDVDRLLETADRHYAACQHRRVDLGDVPLPALEARLGRDGYRERRFMVMVLEGELRSPTKPCDIRAIQDPADWGAFERLRRVAWTEEAARLGLPGDPGVATETCLVFRAKAPPVRWWLAREAGEPCGYFASWEGLDGIGQVEDLFVHPEHRHRGIATALLRHCVRDCRAHGAGPVLIVADSGDTPWRMYAAMGFRALTDRREYLRHG